MQGGRREVVRVAVPGRRDLHCFLTLEDGPSATLVVEGALDMDTTQDLMSSVWRVAAERPTRLVLDCAGITFCAVVGVTALLQAHAAMAAAGARLVLRDPSPELASMLDATGCRDVFTIWFPAGGTGPA